MGSTVTRVAVLGSTGSIGQQALDVIRALPHRFQIIGLTAGQNTELFNQQINEFKPKFVHCQSPAELTGECQSISPEDIASHPQVDTVVVATPGRSGLSPTLAAVKAGKNIALANKESLVTAGEIIIREAGQSGAKILPVDGEHSAIWQCLQGEPKSIKRLILTASGGPFYGYSIAELGEVTVEQALGHPTWRMGKKITIDCATLMNKGLEIMEARWLFDVPLDRIDVLIHPQSIVHSMVEFIDGSVKAQLSYPDMRLPIQYALGYPERLANQQLPRLDWSQIKSLDFQLPDMDTFPCLRLAIEAGRKGGTCPVVLCAADEVAVDLFLSRKIRFTDIARLVEETLQEHQPISQPTLDDIVAADRWARDKTKTISTGESK